MKSRWFRMCLSVLVLIAVAAGGVGRKIDALATEVTEDDEEDTNDQDT